jgi:hypothetical protein
MNENRVAQRAPASPARGVKAVSAASLAALGAVAIAPMLTLACGGNSNAQPNTAANGMATAQAGPPPAGYPQQGYPPGYPGQPGYAQQPPAGYPQQQPPPGYAQQPQQPYPAQPQPGYPAQPQPGYPQAQPQPGYPAQPQPAPTASAAPPPLAPTDPNSLQGILQGIQGALGGTMVAGGALSGDLTDAGLKAQAMRVAPGMQPEGDELKQTLNEGQHAVIMVTLQAGKCYTIVGFSPLGGVKNLDLNLLAPPLYMTLSGQDLTHNNTPTIGAAPSPMCPVIAFPLQYKLDVVAQQGSGQVAVQLYSKAK